MGYARKDGKPYVWVTWITKLLAGEEKCWLRTWFRARFTYDKLAESPERVERLAKWTETHDAMVAKYADEMRARGHGVRVEDENAFKLEGKTAIVAGKPDILIDLGATGHTVIDAKSGRQRESDKWQIRVYRIALPRTVLAHVPEEKLSGRVLYREMLSDFVHVEPEHRKAMKNALAVIASPKPPAASPSRFECDRCDIADCTFRFKLKDAASGQTDLF